MNALFLVGLIASGVAVAIHLLGLRAAIGLHSRLANFRRLAVAATVLTALVVHLLEISLWAVLIREFVQKGTYGGLDGAGPNPTLSTVFYFTAVTYTTLGFGDITPTGQLRDITAILALTGMILAGFTASAIILVVQRSWSISAHAAPTPPSGG